jgi:hypothetical protein
MTSRPRSACSPLAHPHFRAPWIASVASHIGSYMTDVGQAAVSDVYEPRIQAW